MMELRYYPETDSLRVSFNSRKVFSSDEIAPGVVVDYDAEGNVVAIDFEEVKGKVDLSRLLITFAPDPLESVASDR